MIATGNFNVFMGHVQLGHLGNPVTCYGNGNQFVLISLHNDDRHVPDFFQIVRAALDCRCHRRQGSPFVGILHANVIGATTAHGMTH